MEKHTTSRPRRQRKLVPAVPSTTYHKKLYPREDLLSVPQLKDRGWTDAMIRDLLGEPDDTRQNPNGVNKPRMKMWLVSRVDEVECDPAFSDRLDQARTRSAVGTKTAEIRAKKLTDLVSQIEITVVQMPMADAVECAISHYNLLKGERVGLRYDWQLAAADSDPEFLDRITVNFLRHEGTTYDSLLRKLKGLVGKDQAYVLIHNRTLDAIAEAYPDLEWACEKQRVRNPEPWERELRELERKVDRLPAYKYSG